MYLNLMNCFIQVKAKLSGKGAKKLTIRFQVEREHDKEMRLGKVVERFSAKLNL